MARGKTKSLKYKARLMAAKRKQETPEQRATRLESMRNYARCCRQKETEFQREERLKSMRWYSKTRWEKKKEVMRRERIALVLEHCRDARDSDSEAPEEIQPINFVTVEMK